MPINISIHTTYNTSVVSFNDNEHDGINQGTSRKFSASKSL